jgi:exonuclease III
MLQTYKIATLNINGIASHTKMRMLGVFLMRQEIDIVLLQKVAHTDFTTIRDYNAIVNEDTDERGTEILTMKGLQLLHINRIPTGRGIAAMFQGMWIVNIYAPSGVSGKRMFFFLMKTHICYLQTLMKR